MTDKKPPNFRENEGCFDCIHVKHIGSVYDVGQSESRCKKHGDWLVYGYNICDDFQEEPPRIVAVSDIMIVSQMSEEYRNDMQMKSCNACEHYINASYEYQHRVFCKAKAGNAMYDQKFQWVPEYVMTLGPLYLPSEMLQTECKGYKLFKAKKR
jgi:hypothetical protein